MGLVVVISLPLILLCILMGIGCYFLGRKRGREEARCQVMGAPAPPLGSYPNSPAPPPPFYKQADHSHV
ncbi:uncharacterized protein [Spinacia oleracea]|uniref:Transmembrane protein n=1 Tax=Spinacia oleracea TaxID=3562 RepID=A0A9R0HS43_SPIOL|nr:uncharacterized protein LOC110775338 [Spinacia oleracea]